MALITPLLIIISPPLSKPRLSIAAELFVVTVTSPLIVRVPFTVPIPVLAELISTSPLRVIPFFAEIPTCELGTLMVESETSPASAYTPYPISPFAIDTTSPAKWIFPSSAYIPVPPVALIIVPACDVILPRAAIP